MTSSPSQTEEFNPQVWLAEAVHQQALCQQQLHLDMMMGGTIDEVSLLFKSVGMMERFIGWCEGRGDWVNFSSVKRDTATQLYGNSLAQIGNVAGPAFDVRFEFLKPRGTGPYPFRIECMCILEGFAPLHERIPEGGVAHASWKCHNLAHYNLTCEGLDRAAHLPKMAEYANSYGKFAYFGNEAPHFKPRVNLRDS